MAGRISTAQIFDGATAHVSTARERESLSADKSATGKEFTRPSQNPGGYILANTLRDELSSRESMAKNASLASNVLAMQETVFGQVQEIAQRAHEIAVSAAGEDGTSSAARKLGLAEAENLFDSALQAFNTRYGNRTLLAGYHNSGAAFDPQGKFLGDFGEIEIEVAPGSKVAINLTADRAVYGVGVERGVNVLEVLQRLANGMRMNDTVAIRSTLEDLQKANDQMSLMRGEIGARENQISQAVNAHDESKVNMTAEISKIEDADAVKVFSDLARDQTVLKAAISTSEKILHENPTDILFK